MKSLREMKNNYYPVEVPALGKDEIQWFRDSKFGMFIHWGLYAILGRGEWVMFNERISTSEYANLAASFHAEEFDPKHWARTAKSAGMKYMVLTARHHDGFSLFDTGASDFNSVNAAAGRDLVAEYVKACRDEGLKVGLYYSPMDWRFPGYFFPEMYLDSALAMKEQCWTQIRELMTNYGKIDMLWYDGEWLAHGGIKWGADGWTREKDFLEDELHFKVNYFWESEKLNAMVRELQPGIMINNRSGWEGDFEVRERKIGSIRTDKPWDSCDCLTQSWGYIPNAPMLTLKACIHHLIHTVTRDGNYLLNVGPTAAGEIEERQIDLLHQVGNWIDLYAHTIYGTRGGPFQPSEWGGATYSGHSIYLHITSWPDKQLILPKWKQPIIEWRGHNVNVINVVETDNEIVVSVPNDQKDEIDTIVELQFRDPIEWEGISAVEDGIYGLADGLS
ncbi:alpha-L-fucosidase [Paenibacillus donghaensis]|uniref:alpha-L-fucosidase n=1 Tax=Paenibacillus donghaensis TaxID=414771 RepID=A0A2Z2K9Y2_9BACL|nr:alpha-L-fucosidase [Paenibacillus donghaensis]ASA23496.1 hypothetical protein B9T62_23445 [Paenibacillus donghaensis]